MDQAPLRCEEPISRSTRRPVPSPLSIADVGHSRFDQLATQETQQLSRPSSGPRVPQARSRE